MTDSTQFLDISAAAKTINESIDLPTPTCLKDKLEETIEEVS